MDSVSDVLLSAGPIAWIGAFGVSACAVRAGLPRLPVWACAAAALGTLAALGGLLAAPGGVRAASVSAAWSGWLDGSSSAWPRIEAGLRADLLSTTFALAQTAAALIALRAVARIEDATCRGRACGALAVAAFAGLLTVFASNGLLLAIGWHVSALAAWQAGRGESHGEGNEGSSRSPPLEGVLDVFLVAAVLVSGASLPEWGLSVGPQGDAGGTGRWGIALAGLIGLSFAVRCRSLVWLIRVADDARAPRVSACLQSAVLWPGACYVLLRYVPVFAASREASLAVAAGGVATAVIAGWLFLFGMKGTARALHPTPPAPPSEGGEPELNPIPPGLAARGMNGRLRVGFAAAGCHGLVLLGAGLGERNALLAAAALGAAVPAALTALRIRVPVRREPTEARGGDGVARWIASGPIAVAAAVAGFIDRQIVRRALPASLRLAADRLSALHATLETENASLPVLAALLATAILALALLP